MKIVFVFLLTVFVTNSCDSSSTVHFSIVQASGSSALDQVVIDMANGSSLGLYFEFRKLKSSTCPASMEDYDGVATTTVPVSSLGFNPNKGTLSVDTSNLEQNSMYSVRVYSLTSVGETQDPSSGSNADCPYIPGQSNLNSSITICFPRNIAPLQTCQGYKEFSQCQKTQGC